MIHAVLDRLDMAIEHGCVCFESSVVDLAGELEPAVGIAFVIADTRTRRLRKDLSTAAGTRIHSGSVQLVDHVLIGHFIEPRKKIELDHRQSFQMQLWKLSLER